MRNFRLVSLLVLAMTLVWSLAARSEPAVVQKPAVTAPSASQPSVEMQIDPMLLLQGQYPLGEATPAATCPFPLCQPGPGCGDGCEAGYQACITYCAKKVCRSLYLDCTTCCNGQ